MFGNGKKTSVITEPEVSFIGEDILHSDTIFYIWFDVRYMGVLEGTEGVLVVLDDPELPGRFMVFVDPRYDIKFIRTSIEHYIKVNEGEINN
jgi:hypothetical protein